MLVSGYSGIGKSAVVNELHKPLVPPRGFFASGKFDQYKRDIPYATLAQAFQGLIRPLLSKSDEELRQGRTRLREALEPNGQLIVDLVPELNMSSAISRRCRSFPPRGPETFSADLPAVHRGVRRPEHPLALFLDDLQWLDAATLNLLEDLLIRSDLSTCCSSARIGTTRSVPRTRCVRKLDAIREAGAAVQDIVLSPLGRDDRASCWRTPCTANRSARRRWRT